MYFDYAATTPPHPEVLKTFEAVNRDFWANPHALHPLAIRAESLLEQARTQVLELFGVRNEYRCVFASGATEANNMALCGMARAYRQRGNHIITSTVEHPSVSQVCSFLEAEGFELTVLPVNAAGAVEPDVLREALRPDTILVSLMHVNNEVGAINDIMALGRIVKEQGLAVFHVDAAQSVGKFPLSLDQSPIDLLSFSAHKFFGLKGSGALLFKARIPMFPLLRGGGQEAGFRSGTVDVASAAALAKALRLSLEDHEAVYARVQSYKETVVDVLTSVEGVELNGSLEGSSPFVLNCSVEGIRPETLLQALGEQEIYISTVSACSSQKNAESHVVRAMTGNEKRAQHSIRLSFSSQTTQIEIDILCKTIGSLIESLRFKRK